MKKKIMTRYRTSFGFVAALCFLFGIWLIASLLVQKTVLPSPITVLEKLPLLFSKGMLQHVTASLYRIAIGMGVAVLLGFLLGLLMGSLPRWQSFFSPLIYLTYPIPKMALLPIVMLLGGLGDLSKIIMIVLIVTPQVLVAVRDAVLEIPAHYYDVYRCIGGKKSKLFYKITLPACLPAVFSTSRVSLGTAISILFFTENYGTEYGMGYFIMDAWMRMDYPAMYGGILLLSLLGLVLFILLDVLADKTMRWRNH